MKNLVKYFPIFLFFFAGFLDLFASAAAEEASIPFAPIRAQSVSDVDTALLRSCLSGNLEDVTRCLEVGANVDAQTDRGLTALMCAVIGQNIHVVSMLCERAANIHRMDIHGENALQWALNMENSFIESYLRARGAKIVQISPVAAADEPLILRASSGKAIDTDFLNACLDGTRKQIKIFLDGGADINAEDIRCDATGNMLFNGVIIALVHKSSKLLRFLCQRGAKVDFDYPDGNTPLVEVAHKGFLELVSILCEFNANVNHVNRLGRTALMEAVGQAHSRVVDFLCTHGANVDAADAEGTTSLMMAAAQNDEAMVSLSAWGPS